MTRFLQSAAVAALFLIAATGATTGHSRSWNARLSGSQESPPIKSKASGTAMVSLVAFGDSSVHYRITTTVLNDVTMAHFHAGAKGENGPIVVTLQTPAKQGNIMVSKGVIHASDLSGPMAGKRLDEFAASVDSGNVYVNVHTQAHPDGEVRGQLHSGSPRAEGRAKKAAKTP